MTSEIVKYIICNCLVISRPRLYLHHRLKRFEHNRIIRVPNYRIHKILNFLTKMKGSTIFDKASTPFWKNYAPNSFRVRIRVRVKVCQSYSEVLVAKTIANFHLSVLQNYGSPTRVTRLKLQYKHGS